MKIVKWLNFVVVLFVAGLAMAQQDLRVTIPVNTLPSVSVPKTTGRVDQASKEKLRKIAGMISQQRPYAEIDADWQEFIRADPGLDLESTIATLTEMSQLDQMSLQDTMQKQAQQIQTISNIAKNLRDTAKAIIDNIRD